MSAIEECISCVGGFLRQNLSSKERLLQHKEPLNNSKKIDLTLFFALLFGESALLVNESARLRPDLSCNRPATIGSQILEQIPAMYHLSSLDVLLRPACSRAWPIECAGYETQRNTKRESLPIRMLHILLLSGSDGDEMGEGALKTKSRKQAEPR
jgi:hypothetical protein